MKDYLKSVRENANLLFKSKHMRITSDLSSETLKPKMAIKRRKQTA
jgi:hypothetical protein